MVCDAIAFLRAAYGKKSLLSAAELDFRPFVFREHSDSILHSMHSLRAKQTRRPCQISWWKTESISLRMIFIKSCSTFFGSSFQTNPGA